MSCFPVLKSKKKHSEKTIPFKRVNPQGQSPTALPEPQAQTRSLQSAPPSFKTRVKPVQANSRAKSSRERALSAPSSFDDTAEQVFLDDFQSPGPQPLPLPSPLKTMGSFKTGNLSPSGPLPLPPMGTLRIFSYEEIAAACHSFSPEWCMSEGLSSVFYRASFGDNPSGGKKFEATVTCFRSSSLSLKEFVNEVNTLASLQHPSLCKLIGFHAREGLGKRMLVYERLFHGSLDRVLFGRSDGPPIDWNARMKIALCAAQGLTFLHEEGPFQAMFHEFSAGNIQIDKDFSAKLSGYGSITHIQETAVSAIANLTPKSNVWSFGIVLLELLTGRRNLDSRHPKEECNLVKWSWPFLADDCRLTLIMDPQLKGRFPSKAARTMADIAQKCLQKEPSARPTMRTIAEQLKSIQDMKYPSRFPLQEPGRVSMKHRTTTLVNKKDGGHHLHLLEDRSNLDGF